MRPVPAPNSIVERAAREALRAQDPELPDLMLNGIPFTPASWHICIEPLKPRKESDGGIAVVDLSQEAEYYKNNVGRVLSAGPESFGGKTTAGIELKNFTDKIHCREELIGQYVIYKPHTGIELTLRDTGQIVKVHVLNDFVGVTEDPYAWKFYI
jgi:hypothetical protein